MASTREPSRPARVIIQMDNGQAYEMTRPLSITISHDEFLYEDYATATIRGILKKVDHPWTCVDCGMINPDDNTTLCWLCGRKR